MCRCSACLLVPGIYLCTYLKNLLFLIKTLLCSFTHVFPRTFEVKFFNYVHFLANFIKIVLAFILKKYHTDGSCKTLKGDLDIYLYFNFLVILTMFSRHHIDLCKSSALAFWIIISAFVWCFQNVSVLEIGFYTVFKFTFCTHILSLIL